MVLRLASIAFWAIALSKTPSWIKKIAQGPGHQDPAKAPPNPTEDLKLYSDSAISLNQMLLHKITHLTGISETEEVVVIDQKLRPEALRPIKVYGPATVQRMGMNNRRDMRDRSQKNADSYALYTAWEFFERRYETPNAVEIPRDEGDGVSNTLVCALTDTNGPVLRRDNIKSNIDKWCDSLNHISDKTALFLPISFQPPEAKHQSTAKMVGVPGRSKACVTCRSRKKGCDKKLPNCSQCIALGVVCGGYQRKPVWLNADGARQAIYSKAPGNTTSSGHLNSSEAASNITLHDSLTTTARAQKYTGLFWSDYLSGGNGFSTKASGITSTQWMRLYEILSKSEPTLRYTTMALSTAALTTNASDEIFKQKSQEAYGLALRQMATSLASQECNKDGLLAAIQLMRVYEQLFGVDPITKELNGPASRIRGFVKHVDGETALVLSCGPNETWSFTGCQLVLDGRLDLINTGISRRRASPFSQHQWRTSILWQRARESPLKRLLDIMVKVPGLLESLDDLRRTSDPEESLRLHSRVVAKCEACRIELLVWEMEQGETLRVYDYIVNGELSPPQNDEDLASVYLSCYYWMKIDLETVNERVRQVSKLFDRAIRTGIPSNAPEEPQDTLETAALLRKIAGESIVLLKNENNALPFNRGETVAVIGANAKTAVFCGGGSATLRPYYAVSPFQGIADKTDDVRYSVGCHAHKMLPLLGPRLKTVDGKCGVTFRAFTSPDSDHGRQPVDELLLDSTDMYFADYYHPKITEDLWFGEIEAIFEADETCDFEFGLCVFGTARLYVDDEFLVDNETVVFASGAASKLGDNEGVVSYGSGGLRIGGAKVIDPDEEIANAVQLARSVDQVLCVGLNSDFEQEGHDRSHMDLPGRTDELVAEVAKVNPRTVVVVQSGSPVSMPWANDVAAVIQAWYGGNETGNAIADVLFGDVNPSGKLPLSFPTRIEDNPAFLNYRSEHGQVLYGEDVYVGYRYYETVKKTTLWPFGLGLSYTIFSLSNLQVQQRPGENGQLLLIDVTVENIGQVGGAEVVQVYASQRTSSIKRPIKELKGFSKVSVEPGKSSVARITIERKYATSYWDETRHKWTEEGGIYDLLVGTSSRDTPLKGMFEVADTTWWSGL
ncbi:hypothetical protein FSARC_13644 [Fusarium sarcochroum]|uniref:Probable beta-glucosidase I n=1 Tax=Fusarium sarcochroum TaxID=1208366 RepID=A0A8H4WSZ6_9HYPO|nr:hypothetical protein FSARC_13644 [Fusarium sarcochroum]